MLARHMQQCPTRHQRGDPRAGDEKVHEIRTPGEDVLEIVQHQQKLPVPESIGHGVNGRLPWRLGNAEDLPHGGENTAWLPDRR